jgi:hypothetical protein
MATQLFANNAKSTLDSSITNVATSLSVIAGHGARFPTITGSDYFLATLCQVSGGVEVNFEIVKVTARSTDAFTIVRAQEGTTGLAYNAGDKVELRITKGTMEGLQVTTAAQGTNTTQGASTAFVINEFGKHKNLIIGGDFSTNPWQRGTTFTALATTSYGADRWKIGNTTAGVVDMLKSTDGPTAAEAGVYTTSCLTLDVTTVDASIAVNDYYMVQQVIEGLNSLSLGFGQAGTRYCTLSFWHKHTKTGTYCAGVTNATGGRSYVAEYTQAVTNTWEKATLTIPVDTSGTWLYTSGIGVAVRFAVVAGSTFQTTANTWAAGNYLATSNQVNALDSTSNFCKFALIQLEAGSVATQFETRSVGQELALCQRYYQTMAVARMSVKQDTAYIACQSENFIPMRDTPTWTNPSTTWATAYPTAGQMAAYNFVTASYLTIVGALTVSSTEPGVSSWAITMKAGTSFSGTAGNTLKLIMGTAPALSAEL